jgi:hypothetical protein
LFTQIRAQSRRDQVLIFIFAVLIVYEISTVMIVISGIPDYHQRVTTQTVPSLQMGSQVQVSNELLAEKAQERGLTLEQALKRFAATARDEMDIEQLKGELLVVVQETVQPEKIGIWLLEMEKKA